MGGLLLKLFNMSFTAGWIVLAVLLFRVVFRRAPKWVYCLLWSFVGLRLVLPFSFQSRFSIIPSTTVISTSRYVGRPYINTGITALNSTVNDYLGENYFEGVSVPADNFSNIMNALAVVWFLGIALMLAYGVISYRRVGRTVGASLCVADNIYICDDIDTPFILGIFRPRIYVPSGLSEEHYESVISHERAHLARRDHIWKPLGFALLTIYWFNPVMWLAYLLLCRDIERACDERVVRDMDAEQKKGYSEALAFCGVQRRMIAVCPLAFGEVAVKDRIRSILSYKKPAFWIVVTALVASVVAAVLLLTDPLSDVDDELEALFEEQIHAHNESVYTEGNFCAVDWKLVGKSGYGSTVTYYMWTMYQEYSGMTESGELIKEGGSHIFVAMRVMRDGDGYAVLEYWTPKDGAYYDDSIKDKVPFHLWLTALDSEWYVDEQKENCERAAREYFSNMSEYVQTDMFTYDGGPDPLGISIAFMPDGNCSFTTSLFSSHLCFGKSEIKDGYLSIVCDYDASHIWVFREVEEGFVFDASRSCEVPKFKYSADSEPEPGIVDGALFKRSTVGKYKYYPYSYVLPEQAG